MKKHKVLSAFLLTFIFAYLPQALCTAQENDQDDKKVKAKIESLLQTQVDQWNKKDLKGFMQTYWKSEKLTFSSGGKTTRGWQQTFDRYKRRYQGYGAEMGKLHFDKIEMDLLSDKACLVLGRWHLKMEKEKLEGNFSLVLKKMDGGWKIVHDHSSSLDDE